MKQKAILAVPGAGMAFVLFLFFYRVGAHVRLLLSPCLSI